MLPKYVIMFAQYLTLFFFFIYIWKKHDSVVGNQLK